MPLTLAIRLTADGKQLRAEVVGAERDLDRLGAAAEASAQSALEAGAGLDRLAAGGERVQGELTDVERRLEQVGAAAEASAQSALEAGAGLGKLAAGGERVQGELVGVVRRLEQVGTAAKASTKSAIAAGAGLGEAAAGAGAAAQGFGGAAEEIAGAGAAAGAAMPKLQGIGEGAARGAEQARRALQLTRNQVLTLQYTVNDVVASLASGMSPFTILMQQGGQVTQAFGGLRGTLAALAPAFTGVTAVVAGTAAAVGALVAANQSHQASVLQVQLAYRAMGAAAGTTSGQLEAMARAAADAGGISVRVAREIEAGLLRTGRIGGDMLERLTAMTRDYARASGQELAEAGQDLAEIFADPARGADRLQSAYGILNDRTRQLIRTMAAQGERTKAQELLADALQRRVRGLADDGVLPLAAAWEAVAKAAGDAWDAIGRATMPETNGQAIVRLRAELEQLRVGQQLDQKRLQEETGGEDIPPAFVPNDSRYSAPGMVQGAEEARKHAELQRRLAQQGRDRELAARSRQLAADRAAGTAAGDIARSVDPLHGIRFQLDAQIATMERGLRAGTVDPAANPAEQLERLSNARRTLMTDTEKAVKLAEAERQAAAMTGVEREKFLARARTEIELSGQLLTTKEREERVRAAVAAITAGQTQATIQATRELAANAEAAHRLAEAQGRGAAAVAEAEKQNRIEAEVLRLGEGARAAVTQAIEEETSARRALDYAAAIAGMDREIESLERLAAAHRQGAAAVAEAELQSRLDVELRRRGLSADDPRAAEIERRMRRQAELQRQIGSSQSLRSKREELELAELELRLLGASDEVRAQALARLRAEQDLRRRNIDLKSEEAKAELALSERIAGTTAKIERWKRLQGDLSQVIARSTEDAIVNFRKVSDVLAGLEQDLIRITYRAAIGKPFEDAITGLIGDIDFGSIFGSIFGGGASPSGILPGEFTGPGTGWIYHTGGVIGTDRVPTRAVDPAVFAGAPRRHMGGLVAGEVPIVAELGEEVITRRDPRHRWNGGLDRAGGALAIDGGVVVNVFDQRSGEAAPIEFGQRRGANGVRQIDVFVRDAWRRQHRDGAFDRDLSSSHGLGRSPIPR